MVSRFGKNEDPEDIEQEALIILLKHKGACETYSFAQMMCLAALRNSGLKKYGGKMRHKKFSRFYLKELPLEDIDEPVAEGNPGDDLGKQDVLKGYSTADRAMLLLYYVWGMTLHEVADIFGVPPSRIYQRLQAITVESKFARSS